MDEYKKNSNYEEEVNSDIDQYLYLNQEAEEKGSYSRINSKNKLENEF